MDLDRIDSILGVVSIAEIRGTSKSCAHRQTEQLISSVPNSSYKTEFHLNVMVILLSWEMGEV